MSYQHIKTISESWSWLYGSWIYVS